MAGLALGGAAQATDVVLAVDGCSQGGSGVLARSLRAQLAAAKGSNVLTEAQTAQPLGGLPDGSLADAQRFLGNARFEVLEQAAYDRAERTLRTAEGQLARLPPSEERWRAIEELKMMRGAISLKRDRHPEAERELIELLRVDADFQPDPDRYPPSVRALVDSLRARVKKEPRARVTVSTLPEQLALFVDGKPIGSAPKGVELTLGVHQVEADFQGRRGLPREVHVEGPTHLELEASFEGAIYPDRGPCFQTTGLPADRLAALSRLAPLWNAGQLFTTRLSEESGTAYLIGATLDGVSGAQLREGKVRLGPEGLPPGAMASLAEFLSTGKAVAPVEPLDGIKRVSIPGLEGRTLARPLTIGLAATGALALAAGGYFALQASAANGRLMKLCPSGSCPVGVDEQAFAADDRARSRSGTAAVVLAAAGIGALIAGGVLWLAAPRADALTAQAISVTAEGWALTW